MSDYNSLLKTLSVIENIDEGLEILKTNLKTINAIKLFAKQLDYPLLGNKEQMLQQLNSLLVGSRIRSNIIRNLDFQQK